MGEGEAWARVRLLGLIPSGTKEGRERERERIPAQQTCGWAWSPGVLTDPYARQRERECAKAVLQDFWARQAGSSRRQGFYCCVGCTLPSQ